MRHNLAKFEGQKMFFRATVRAFGKKKNKRKQSLDCILLTELRDENFNEQLEDHVWCYNGKRFSDQGLDRGDIITFYATVRPYFKGKNKNIKDFRLDRPSRIQVVNRDRNMSSLKIIPLEKTPPARIIELP